MTTGKNIALTRWTFVGKEMSQLLNMLSRLVITFLPGSKCPLISWLQSPSAVILEPPKIKSDTVSTVSPSIPMKCWGQKHKLESRLLGDISITSDMQMTPPLWWKVKKLNSLLKMKEESEIPG